MDADKREMVLFNTVYDDVEELMDKITEVIKCPVTLENVNHRVIAYSTHDEGTDPARIATIIRRRVPERVINTLWKHGVIPALLKTDQPIRIKKIDEIGLGDRVAISIRKKKEVLGFIWVQEKEEPLTDEDLDFLIKAAHVASNFLLRQNKSKKIKEEGYQDFFWKLLTGHINNQEEIIDNFARLKIKQPQQVGIMVFRFPQEIKPKTEKQISYLLKTTQRLIIIFHTYDTNHLILLVSPLKGKNLKEFNEYIPFFVEQMKERFGIASIFGTRGMLYKDLTKIQKSYNEALYVQKIKECLPKEMKDIFSYKDLGIYQFLDIISKKRCEESLENQALRRLIDYDKKTNSNLIETLEIYLDKDNNVIETAKELHIHVNTLNYRLKRITEIGQINLKNPNQKMGIFLDLKIEKMKKYKTRK